MEEALLPRSGGGGPAAAAPDVPAAPGADVVSDSETGVAAGDGVGGMD